MFPTGTIVAHIIEDRRREAETARLLRREPQPQPPRTKRRIRALATRIAFTTQR